jgi:outer membrane immunogenic protein
MRRFLLAALVLGAAHGAQAADMPDFFPALRGGFNPVNPGLVNWDGYYVGGQAGYGLINSRSSFITNSDLQATFTPPPGFAYNWSALGAASGNGDSYGAFAGYNSQWDDVVIGIEANYNHNAFRAFTSAAGYTYNPDLTVASVTNSSASIRITDFGSARIRAGYVTGSFLPYAFAGVGVGSQTVDRNISATPAPVFTPALRDSNTKTELVYGYSAGLGLDVMLTRGLFLRAEYEYQRVTAKIDSKINSARVGLGYKF